MARRAAEPVAERRPELVVARDAALRAAAILADWLRRWAAQTSHDAEIRLAIPGGSALAVVAQARREVGSIWSRVALTWVDERCVALASDESNRGAALRQGLFSISDATSPADAFPARTIPLFEEGETPIDAVTRFARRWRDELASGLDLVVLGLGEDGHVASLFPGRVMATNGPIAHVADSPKPPRERMTLTRDALSTARQTLLFAVGPAKRAALERVLANDPALPTTGLPGLVVVTDQGDRPSR